MANLKFSCSLFLLAVWLLGSAALAANHAPVLAPIGAKEALAGEALTFTVAAVDRDEGQVLAYSASGLPAGATLDPKTGAFSWTPAITQLGQQSITFTVTDDGSPPLSHSETVNVRVIFRTVQEQKAWGLGVSGKETLVETSSVADLYPRVSRIEVDGQAYTPTQREIFASENPVIKIDLASPYNIDKGTLAVQLDGAEQSVAALSGIQTFGAQNNILNLTVELSPQDLAAGTHQLTIRSGNELGASTQTIAFSVGGLNLVGLPLSFPSPYNPNTGSLVLQYTLTQGADIDIMIVGSSGQIIKKITVFKGSEGGRAGLNKVSWDGRPDVGGQVANGIYLAVITEKSARKVLSKIKVTVYR